MPRQPQAVLVAGWQGRAGRSVPCGQRVGPVQGPQREGAKREEFWLLSGGRCHQPGCPPPRAEMEEAAEEEVKCPCYCRVHQEVALEQPPQEQSEAVKPLIALIRFYLRTAEPSQTWQLLRFPCSDFAGLPTSASCTSLRSEPSSMAPSQPWMLPAALAGAGQPLPFLGGAGSVPLCVLPSTCNRGSVPCVTASHTPTAETCSVAFLAWGLHVLHLCAHPYAASAV